MAKAYDRVEWGFLKKMMIKMDFLMIFINLVMKCVTSVGFSILMQGYCFGNFSSTRCLRQGDPISPYLFMIVGEGLSALLQHAK